jgi:hypothetical protein
MELEPGKGHDQPGRLTMAGISSVFTIALVAEMLGEDEDWLHELSMGLYSEDGCLWVHDNNEREVQAFTRYGIECLQQIIADERAGGRAPKPKAKS